MIHGHIKDEYAVFQDGMMLSDKRHDRSTPELKLKTSNPVYGFCWTIKLESCDDIPIASFGIVAQLTNRIPPRR